MADGNYVYTKASVNLRKLNLEILAESFSQTLQYTSNDETGSDNLHIKFAADLLAGEVTTLTTLVTNHDGNPPNHYEYFCYCCGLNYNEYHLSTPTQCQICSSTDIQMQYHKCNLIATIDPTVDDDDTENYYIGSLWINVTSNDIFKCVDVTTGAAIWENLTHLGAGGVKGINDYIENFDKKPDNLPMKGGTSKLLYNDFLFDGSGHTLSQLIASELIMNVGASGNGNLFHQDCFNPADSEYIEWRWKQKYENASECKTCDYIADEAAWEFYVYFTWVNATTINVFITDGVLSDDEDITIDTTVEHEFCVQCKDGTTRILIDDVVKITWTTAGGDAVLYDAPIGVSLTLWMDNAHVVQSRWAKYEYAKVLRGRSF